MDTNATPKGCAHGEPVAWGLVNPDGKVAAVERRRIDAERHGMPIVPLYACPASRPPTPDSP